LNLAIFSFDLPNHIPFIMKKVIILTLFLILGTQIARAQNESNPEKNDKVESENISPKTKEQSPKSPLISINLPHKDQTPIATSGRHLTKAGTLLTVASISATAGTLLYYIDAPLPGIICSLVAVVCEFTAYSQLKKAGHQLQIAESKKQ
jgi:hypothetical protein